MLCRQRAFGERDSSAPCRCLDASRDNKRQRALIMNRNPRVLHSEFGQNCSRLLHDRRAVIGRNARLQRDLDAAAVTRLKGDVHVRPNFFAPMARLGRTRGRSVGSAALHNFLNSRSSTRAARVAYFSFSKIASVICTVEAAPWLMAFGPPVKRIIS